MKLNFVRLIFYKLIYTFIHLKNNESAAFLADIRFLLLNIQHDSEDLQCENKHKLHFKVSLSEEALQLICSKCDCKLIEEDGINQCTDCQYYLCINCFNKLQPIKIKTFIPLSEIILHSFHKNTSDWQSHVQKLQKIFLDFIKDAGKIPIEILNFI